MATPTVINNFIDKETAAYLNQYLKSISEINPKGKYSVMLTPLDLSKYDHPESLTIQSYLSKLFTKVKSQFGFERHLIQLDRALYQYLETGDEIGWHTDSKSPNNEYGGVEGYDTFYWSALLYLNDDYEGGELCFYDENNNKIEYKTETGSLVYFRGDENTPHSVNKIISGQRANIIFFYRGPK